MPRDMWRPALFESDFDSPWHESWMACALWTIRIAHDKQGWYWISKGYPGRRADDVGPFETFEAAAACFEVLGISPDESNETLRRMAEVWDV